MTSPVLAAASEPLSLGYDLAMLDLDGVVYIGGEAVVGAATHLAAVREAGMRVAFITNNAARPASEVASHLTELGVPAAEEDVVTSAQAAAAMVARRFGTGATVMCCGGPGLVEALRDAGLVVGERADAAAIVTGYGPDLPWRSMMQAAVAIKAGLPWVASNTDATIPTADGIAPGHGALVELLARFSGVTPEVAGKPATPLLEETIGRVGASRPLMVGDRLDTDIAGARNAGVDSLLVLTGVTGLPELVRATPGERPTYLSCNLAGLNAPHRSPGRAGDSWWLEGWQARASTGGRLEVVGSGSADAWWRVVAAASWEFADRRGHAVDVTTLEIPGSADGAG